MPENDPLKKLLAWAKEHKQIAIPAAGVIVVGGVYLASKSGGLSLPSGSSAGSSTAQAGQPGGDTSGGSSSGGGSDPYGQAIADLQNQLVGSQNQSQTEIAALTSAQQGLASQFAQQLSQLANGLTGQVNQALQQQQAQTQNALSQLAAQQQSYGQNGLGQLLAQIPQYVAPQAQYSSYTPEGHLPAALPSITPISFNIPKNINTGAFDLGQSLGSILKSFNGYTPTVPDYKPFTVQPVFNQFQQAGNVVGQAGNSALNSFAKLVYNAQQNVLKPPVGGSGGGSRGFG